MHDIRFRLIVAAALACCSAAALAQVTPPPLPPGHHLVRPEAGMSEPERKRHVRAHHHKFHHKKDFTRDDSIHGHESEVAARGGAAQTMGAGQGTSGSASGAAARVPAGQAGPVREKTDRGASSYFYGNDKK